MHVRPRGPWSRFQAALLGAVAFGAELRNRTWGTVFTQEPRRLSVVLAKAAALAVAVVAITMVDIVVLAKGTAVAVGIGLVWVLAVEDLMSSLPGIAPVFQTVRAALPGGRAGSVVSALGGSSGTMPGVARLGATGVEAGVLAAHAVVALLVTAAVVCRRDA